ncbi:MAG TPA: hypothetical protein VFX78_11960 [Candidatus Eisenbacteria bacterium]|nr:hypothetical protein [Candidatus Eisenbacteria bacterium]
MPEWLSLYLVLCWLRFFECATWRPSGAVVFRGGSRRACDAVPRDGVDGRAGFVIANPLWPFRGVFVSGAASDGDFDVDDLGRRLEEYRQSARSLLRAEGALSVHLFVVLPVVWSIVGITRAWPYLLVSLLVLHVLVLVTFFHAHRRVFGSSRMERWSAAVPFLLAPPMATAAHLALTKGIARNFHPVAAGFHLCDDESFRDLALPYVRRSEFPVGDPVAEDRFETPPDRRGDLRALVEERLGSIDLRPSSRQSEAAQAYCPRCLSEYAEGDRTCVDCAGVALRAFPSN